MESVYAKYLLHDFIDGNFDDSTYSNNQKHLYTKDGFRGNNSSIPKIQQTKMLVTCQRFGDWFLFGLVWPYSYNQKNIGSKSLLLTCSSNKL